VHALIEYALLGQLVVDFLLRCVLVLRVGLLALREVMLIVSMAMATAATDCLGDKGLKWLD